MQGEVVVVLMEMTLKNLIDEGAIDYLDFLERVDILGTLGKPVLISNYGEYHRLASYLFRHTKKKIGIAMGVPSLREIFDEKYYADLEGGILESFGRLFKNELKLYVYPLQDAVTGSIITAGNLRVAPHLRLPAGKPFHPEPARLQRRAAPHLLPANPDQNPERRSGLGK